MFSADCILAVDGIDAPEFFHAPQLRSELVGEVGSMVQLEYLTPEGTIERAQLERNVTDIFSSAVTMRQLQESSILYLEIWNFIHDDISGDLRKRLTEVLEGKRPSGIIIDLRKNIGGNIDIMLETAALFLPGDTVIGTFNGRNNQTDVTVPNYSEMPMLKTLPLAVLIGPDTESASEIFVMGLRENDRQVQAAFEWLIAKAD